MNLDTSAERFEFAPPPTRGLLRALGLALLAHAALLAALTWGVHWKREIRVDTAQAELWASLPQEPAPAAPLPAPPPPAPSAAPVAPAAPSVQPVDPAIALERDRERKRKERQLAQQQEQEKREKQLQAQEKREKQLQAQEKKQALAQQQAAEKKKLELDAKRKEAQQQQQEAAQLETQRQANIARSARLAGKADTAAAVGSATQSAGPSQNYASRLVARVKPNIVFGEVLSNNPTAVVEVRTAPDGTITGRRMLKSSGSRAWDEAVMKALDKTGSMPRDMDGRVPAVMELSFRPQE